MRTLLFFFVLMAFSCVGIRAEAGENFSQTKLLEYMSLSAKRWGIQEELILAVAKTESSINPFAINIRGKAYYPQDSSEALELIRKASQEGKSFDTGVMQLNIHTLNLIGISPEVALDPYINILIGSWLLANDLRRFGYTWKAIGNYHTPVRKNPERAKAYAQKVISNLGGL
jgi:soluble lytic murein transglycosylase-like protein